MAPTVTLVNMPFAPAQRPSIQLGILRTLLDQAEIPAREFYFSIDFFDRLRRKNYLSQYKGETPSLVSEWYFSQRAFDPDPLGPDFMAVMRLQNFAKSENFQYHRMLDIRQRLVPEFLDQCTEEVLQSGATIVCFTLSYAQINASFALAAKLKERRPDIITVFGGAGSQVFEEGCREYMRVFPCIDVMALGEAETVFVELIRRLQSGASVHDLPDVMFRDGDAVARSKPESPVLPLDGAAIPAYEAYFEKRLQMPLETQRHLEVTVLIEMGRGCTWGDELTCKFCAFLFHGKYRGKSKQFVLDEMVSQAKRYRTRSFYVVDDIVTNDQITTIFTELPSVLPGATIPFLEMRASTTRRHLEILAKAGVRLVQPGIESMDDGLLKKMSKGTTTFHNIQLMKWAMEAGVRVSHNIILCIPQATREELETQLAVIRRISHLDPPFTLALQLVRFSPYYAERDQYGFKNFQADPFYATIYPDGTDIEKVAYEFVYDDAEAKPLAALYQETADAISRWQKLWGPRRWPYLVFEKAGDGLVVTDGRNPDTDPVIHRFGSLDAQVHSVIADRVGHVESVLRALRPTHPGLEASQVTAILDRFVDLGIALCMRGRYLSLCLELEKVRRRLPSMPKPSAVTT